MCNYNFELPIDPIPLMTLVKQMIEENGGSVTGQVPNVAVSIPTPMGQVAGQLPARGQLHRASDRHQEAGSPDLRHGARSDRGLSDRSGQIGFAADSTGNIVQGV